MLNKGLFNLRKLVQRSFNTATTPFKSYYLKRPWDFHHDDYSLLADQVTMAISSQAIIDIVHQHNEDLNEVHIGYLLQNMFNHYIEFNEGKT
jgi:hypothetical protein